MLLGSKGVLVAAAAQDPEPRTSDSSRARPSLRTSWSRPAGKAAHEASVMWRAIVKHSSTRMSFFAMDDARNRRRRKKRYRELLNVAADGR